MRKALFYGAARRTRRNFVQRELHDLDRTTGLLCKPKPNFFMQPGSSLQKASWNRVSL